MDDTQQTIQPTMGQQQPMGSTMPSMSDVAGMTPPPPPAASSAMPEPISSNPVGMMPPLEPMNPMPTNPMPAEPVMPAQSVAPMPSSTPVMEEPVKTGVNEEDYSYAEDILSEILDSLDRIESKLEAMEKKNG